MLYNTVYFSYTLQTFFSLTNCHDFFLSTKEEGESHMCNVRHAKLFFKEIIFHLTSIENKRKYFYFLLQFEMALMNVFVSTSNLRENSFMCAGKLLQEI